MISEHDRIERLRASGEKKPHGTRPKYNSGCRCADCRRANTQYEIRRSYLRKTGRGNPNVDANPVREHIHNLSRLGVGYKQVADAAKIGHTTVLKIKIGAKSKLRKSTADAILGVDRSCAADHAYVSSRETFRLIDKLVDRGYSKKQLAAWLGSRATHPAIQITRGRKITIKKAQLIKRLYENLQAGRIRRER